MKTIFDVENIDVKKEEPEFKKGDLVIYIGGGVKKVFFFDSINTERYLNCIKISRIFNTNICNNYYFVDKNEIRKPTEKEIEEFFQNEFDKLNKIIKDNNLCVLDSDGFVTSLPKTVKNKC
jgi:hypothetical protein